MTKEDLDKLVDAFEKRNNLPTGAVTRTRNVVCPECYGYGWLDADAPQRKREGHAAEVRRTLLPPGVDGAFWQNLAMWDLSGDVRSKKWDVMQSQTVRNIIMCATATPNPDAPKPTECVMRELSAFGEPCSSELPKSPERWCVGCLVAFAKESGPG